MSNLFSSGAFGLLPMLLSGGNKGGGMNGATQQPMTAVSRQPPSVDPNMTPRPNYWNGNNFVVPGFSNGPVTSKFPQSMLPHQGQGAMAGLTPGQLQSLLGQTLKPGQQATPPQPVQLPQQQPQVPQQGPQTGGFDLQSLLHILQQGGGLGGMNNSGSQSLMSRYL